MKKTRSINYSITISFTSIAIISILTLGNVLYHKVSSTNMEIFKKNTENILEQINLNVDYYLKNIMNISDSIYYNILKGKKFSTNKFVNEAKIIQNINKDFLVRISLFTEKGEFIGAYPENNYNNLKDASNEEWFKTALDEQENIHFFHSSVSSFYNNRESVKTMSLSRSVDINTDNDILQGVLLLDTNFKWIEEIFKNIKIADEGYVYLTDKLGEVIYHPKDINGSIFFDNNFEVSKYEDGSFKNSFNDNERLVSKKTVGYTGWNIISIIPFNNITDSYKDIKLFFFIFTLFIILILAIVNKVVSNKITMPLMELTKKVNDYELGIKAINFTKDKADGSYEVNVLTESLHKMVVSMNDLMKQKVNNEKLKRKSELDVLQSQINPHFLYNTLDSVIWMLESNKNRDSIIMIKSLARLFRLSLNKGKDIIKVKNEIEHAKNYLTIQKIRYKNRFDFTVNIENDIEELYTIKLIVQPIIENAIYHGLESLYDEGEIDINIYIEDTKFLIIDISDNGIGINEKYLDDILKENRKIKSKGSGVGLRNVNERIKLHFGEEYGITIRSELDEGTTVKLKLPLLRSLDLEG